MSQLKIKNTEQTEILSEDLKKKKLQRIDCENRYIGRQDTLFSYCRYFKSGS